MLRNLWNRLWNPGIDDRLNALPLAAAFASSNLTAQLRLLRFPCGDVELVVDVCRLDANRTPVLLLDELDLREAYLLLADCEAYVEKFHAWDR